MRRSQARAAPHRLGARDRPLHLDASCSGCKLNRLTAALARRRYAGASRPRRPAACRRNLYWAASPRRRAPRATAAPLLATPFARRGLDYLHVAVDGPAATPMSPSVPQRVPRPAAAPRQGSPRWPAWRARRGLTDNARPRPSEDSDGVATPITVAAATIEPTRTRIRCSIAAIECSRAATERSSFLVERDNPRGRAASAGLWSSACKRRSWELHLVLMPGSMASLSARNARRTAVERGRNEDAGLLLAECPLLPAGAWPPSECRTIPA